MKRTVTCSTCGRELVVAVGHTAAAQDPALDGASATKAGWGVLQVDGKLLSVECPQCAMQPRPEFPKAETTRL